MHKIGDEGMFCYKLVYDTYSRQAFQLENPWIKASSTTKNHNAGVEST